MMQDIISISPSLTESSLTASASSSNVSRLSISTVVPADSGRHIEINKHHEQQSDTIDSTICSRSQSVRSQDSNNASSSVDTDESRYLYDSADKSTLQRNGSWASTVPTSPETELSVGHIECSNGDFAAKKKESRQTVNSDIKETEESVSTIKKSNFTSSNRNKPLPIPIEVQEKDQSCSNTKGASTGIPSFHINPGSDGPTIDVEVTSISVDGSPTLSSGDEIQVTRKGIKSMMGRSSQLFRRATDSKGPNVKKSPTVPARRKSNGLLTKENLSWFYRSLPPSPNGSVVDLPSTQTDPETIGRNALDSEMRISIAGTEILTSQLPSSGASSKGVKSPSSLQRSGNSQASPPTSPRPQLSRSRSRGFFESDRLPEMKEQRSSKSSKDSRLSHADSIAAATISILEAQLPETATSDRKGSTTHSADVMEEIFNEKIDKAVHEPNLSARDTTSSSVMSSSRVLIRGEDSMSSSRRHSRAESSDWDDDFKSAFSSTSSSCNRLYNLTNSDGRLLLDSVLTQSPALSKRQNLSMSPDHYSMDLLTKERGIPDLSNTEKLNPSKEESLSIERLRHSRRSSGERQLRASKEVSNPPQARSVFLCDFQQNTIAPSDEAKVQRRPSQATLNIVDDVEFLQALEHVRKMNQERIRKKEEVAIRVTQLARMGMASGNKRANRGATEISDFQQQQEKIGGKDRLTRKTSAQKRSSSADARYYSSELNLDASKEGQSIMRGRAGLKDQGLAPSALELGVGKASGKSRDDCAFMNDDDWKQEVKALFVIRELVLTERSYARHLEALLQAIRSHYFPGRKMSINNSSMNRQNGQFPPHFLFMRNLLPQLIALSRSLANRIDDNPTAAGVGAAFRAVHSQMEATFIAWSSSVKEIMEGLRLNEKTKSKSIHRLGLITLIPTESSSSDMISVIPDREDGFISMPSSPKFSPEKAKRFSVGGNSSRAVCSTSSTRASSPTRMNLEGDLVSFSHIAKRRSTFSGLAPPQLAPSKSPSGIGRKAFEAVVSSSKPMLMGPAKTTVLPSTTFNGRKRGLMMSSSGHLSVEQDVFGDSSGDTTPLPSQRIPIAKRLGALDIAIMPTQRLPRYLLLIRDLNTSTPPQSLSHVRLQRSLDMLIDLARRCDQASK